MVALSYVCIVWDTGGTDVRTASLERDEGSRAICRTCDMSEPPDAPHGVLFSLGVAAVRGIYVSTAPFSPSGVRVIHRVHTTSRAGA